jgi:hypothetical protein
MKTLTRDRGAVPVLLRAVAGVAAVVAAAGCGGAGAAKADTTAPTTVFGRQASELAVGIAATRHGRDADVSTTVLAQDGTGKRGLAVALAGRAGRWVPSRPCGGAGRYCGTVPVAGATPEIRVRLTRPSGRASTVSVTLPRRPDPARAGALVDASAAALRRLHSLMVDEYLSSGPPYKPLVTQFSYVAPDRLSYQTSGAGDAVVIGGNRWDRQPSGTWEESPQEPLTLPAPDWRRVVDPSLLGAGRRNGRRVESVSFYDPSVPAWFEAQIDRKTNLPVYLRMVAAAHFMTHTFGAFNAPITILPPV